MITRQARYRIVADNYAGYEAQYQPAFLPGWWPLWTQCCNRTGGAGCNTSSSIEKAETLCKSHQLKRLKPARAGKIVKNLGVVETLK